MPRDLSIKKVLVIGSGPIVIGQAAEFDYAGTQACRSLKAAIAEDVCDMALAYFPQAALKPDWKAERKAAPCVREASWEEREALCAEDPDYGKIVCRCETVTEGQIRRALRSPVPVYTIDGVKRRCRAGMGRCQGSFCTPRVMQIIAEEAGIPLEAVRKAGPGTEIAQGALKAKGGAAW